MAWLTIYNCKKPSKPLFESHFDYVRFIYPSITKEEYEKWIQAGIRAERLARFKTNYYRSPEQLRFSAECRVTEMVHQLIEARKVLRKE